MFHALVLYLRRAISLDVFVVYPGGNSLMECVCRTAAADTVTADTTVNFTATSFPAGENYVKTNFRRKIYTLPLKLRGCPLERVLLAFPTHKACHKGISFECSQTDGNRRYGPCPVRGVQRDNTEYGPCPSRSVDPKLEQHAFPPLEIVMGLP